jgi:hypothetical protein
VGQLEAGRPVSALGWEAAIRSSHLNDASAPEQQFVGISANDCTQPHSGHKGQLRLVFVVAVERSRHCRPDGRFRAHKADSRFFYRSERAVPLRVQWSITAAAVLDNLCHYDHSIHRVRCIFRWDCIPFPRACNSPLSREQELVGLRSRCWGLLEERVKPLCFGRRRGLSSLHTTVLKELRKHICTSP